MSLKYRWKALRLWLRRAPKFTWQKLTRGFHDGELWSLDYRLAKLIHPRLVAFRKIVGSYPGTMTYDEWCAILDQIIAAFEFIATNDDYWCMNEAQYTMVEDGIALFARYYGHLWD